MTRSAAPVAISQAPHRFALVPERLYDGRTMREGQAVVVTGERVEAIVPHLDLARSLSRRELPGTLAPGFVDLQVNGGGDVLFQDDPHREGLARIAVAHRRAGTTAFLATLVSADRTLIRRGIAAVRACLARPPRGGARVLGIHVEGPHLSAARAGAHDPKALRDLEREDLEILTSLPEAVTLVTLAPERVRPQQIRELSAHGVRVLAGHSEASFEEIAIAREAGLVGFTHLFNAMPPLRGREPGVVGAALSDPESYCGVIADGVHVHWANLRLTCRAKPGRVFLVSDAMPPVGGSARSFRLGGEAISVDGDRCARADGTLAGSLLDLGRAVRNVVEQLGQPAEGALAMVAPIPAACAGAAGAVGNIAPGRRADFTLLDAELRVVETWVDGVSSRSD